MRKRSHVGTYEKINPREGFHKHTQQCTSYVEARVWRCRTSTRAKHSKGTDFHLTRVSHCSPSETRRLLKSTVVHKDIIRSSDAKSVTDDEAAVENT